MATSNAKVKTAAADIIAANLPGSTEEAEISEREYKQLCKYADYDPAHLDNFHFSLHGDRYHVNALTIERSRARGGNTSTFTLSRA